ncbi:hypothetical protein [Achromobacter sp.]|uniref:hypothetical protein n=1 Tax=Achromobacter sp. TaxID=134375 RepID=UPI0028AF0947|nr:hypothetical protein [Achromobacter sp.]
MKYATEVLDLLGTYPKRDFRMMEIVNYILGDNKNRQDREAARKAVTRVLQAMENGGSLIRIAPIHERGGYATYRLKSYAIPDDAPGEDRIASVLGDLSPEALARIRAHAKSQRLSDPYHAFMKQKTRSAGRGIGFELTFAEWWEFWQDHYHLRGSGPNDLCMGRYGDTGPYAVGNIYLTTIRGNMADYVGSAKKEADVASLTSRRRAELIAMAEAVANRPPPQYTYEQVQAMLKLGIPFELRAT